MLTIKARLKNNVVEFLDAVDLPDQVEHQILITFLDKDITLFEDPGKQDVLKIATNTRFKLTDKEIKILKFVRQGMTNNQIADKLETTIGTARNRLSHIYKKLKVLNRTGAIAKANKYGLLD